jgi:hypothetical protein
MSRERRLSEDEEAWLGPLCTAMFVDLGWIDGVPLTITKRGLAAIKIGWGPANPPIPVRGLPGTVTELSGGLHWNDRRVNRPTTLKAKNVV